MGFDQILLDAISNMRFDSLIRRAGVMRFLLLLSFTIFGACRNGAPGSEPVGNAVGDGAATLRPVVPDATRFVALGKSCAVTAGGAVYCWDKRLFTPEKPDRRSAEEYLSTRLGPRVP